MTPRTLTFPIAGKHPALWELEQIRRVVDELGGISDDSTVSIDEVNKEVVVTVDAE